MSTVIKVENLSKLYRLGVVGTGTLSHDLNRWWHQVRGKEDPYLKIGEVNDRTAKGGDYSWALRDIDFEVKQGEVLGIIGKNGAGKSTLLKILSRVTQPTTGAIKVKGRIASLLEVGTGFHPELTGRENIFLNGAILGMTKAEIRSKFDEIVDFSGVERYIDTPVKRYSSGMYVRLAFAVAAHLEPEILIIDEVLAVGDAEFQQKCLGKMQDVAGEGRTVLFVSHNMASMTNLCKTGIFMKNGKICAYSTIEKAVDIYIKDNEVSSTVLNLENRIDRKGNQIATFTSVRFLDKKFNETSTLINGQKIFIELTFTRKNTLEQLQNVHFSIGINDNLGNRILLLSTDLTQQTFKSIPPNNNKVCIEIPKLQLKAGIYQYTINLGVNGETSDWVPSAGSFSVENGDFFQTGATLPDRQGFFLVSHNFTLSE